MKYFLLIMLLLTGCSREKAGVPVVYTNCPPSIVHEVIHFQDGSSITGTWHRTQFGWVFHTPNTLTTNMVSNMFWQTTWVDWGPDLGGEE